MSMIPQETRSKTVDLMVELTKVAETESRKTPMTAEVRMELRSIQESISTLSRMLWNLDGESTREF